VNPFDKLLSIMVRPWVVACVVGFTAISFIYLDESIAYFFHGLNLRENWVILYWITNLGLGAIYFVSLLLLALISRYMLHNPVLEARAWFLWLCVIFPSIICFGLKVIFGRARPNLLFGEQMYGFYGFKLDASFWSFPSGHTTTLMGLVFGLAILFPKYCYRLIFLGFFVASSRIFLTNHYFSDVLSASYLALLEIGCLLYWLRRRELLSFHPQQELG
jgi:membrane-associated phospholipid phosphatase